MGGPLISPVVAGRKTCSICRTSKPVGEFRACNHMLGCAKDSPEILRAAICYLGGE